MMTLFHGSPYCFKCFQFRAQSEQEGDEKDDVLITLWRN